MLCPQCNVELRIKASYTEIKDDTAQTVQELYCVNRECPLRSDVIPVKVIRHIHEETVPDRLILCDCGTPLARETKEGYKNHEGKVVDSVICPTCNKSVTIG